MRRFPQTSKLPTSRGIPANALDDLACHGDHGRASGQVLRLLAPTATRGQE